jgi:hypothetical protein
MLWMKQMINLTCSPAKPMLTNIADMENVIRNLVAANGSSTIAIEDLGCARLFETLPNEYSAFRTVVEHQESDFTFAEARAKILNEEQTLKSRKATQAPGFAGITQPNTDSSLKRKFSSVPKCVPHGRTVGKCVLCDPNRKCDDCGELQHVSKYSTRCKLYDPKLAPPGRNAIPAKRSTNFASRFETAEEPPVVSSSGLTPRFAGVLLKRPSGVSKKTLRGTPKSSQDLRHQLSSNKSAQIYPRSIELSPKSYYVNNKNPNSTVQRHVIDSGCENTIHYNNSELNHYSNEASSIVIADSSVIKCPGTGSFDLRAKT